jgi:microsomal dipeptidase-like Zn-dependent dipeptidase
MKVVAIVVIAFAANGIAQLRERLPDLDFEEGLRGWHRAGDAFASQPVSGNDFTANRARIIKVGGDYWHDLPFPIGCHGERLIFTLESKGGDEATGSLISDSFTLTIAQRFFSVLIGGTNDSLRERVELQVLVEAPDDYRVLFSATGHNSEFLRREAFEIPTIAAGRKLRIKISDDSPDGHIDVDDIRFTSQRPALLAGPAWGFADYHTHPMNYMGFGALKNIRTVWGVPGGSVKDYDGNLSKIGDDLPYCSVGHGGGPTAEGFINSADDRQIKRPRGITILTELLAGDFTRHGRYGPPGFRDFPSFLSGAHYQMHITQIRRAWEGGLRLMTAFAVNNSGVEYLVSPVEKGDKISISDETKVVEAQICGIRRLVDLNSDWMEIAYSPDDARRIIRDNKLAIVLGIEVDSLGDLKKGDAEQEIDYLWNLGIRHVFPIHAFNNKLGGAALFEDVYNSTNDLMNRTPRDIGPANVNDGLMFFEVKEGCAGSTEWGECVEYRLRDPVDRVVIKRLIPDFILDRILPPILWKKIPFIQSVKIDAYNNIRSGHMNQRGLCPAGMGYVKALVKKGMLIDLAHMSEQSVTDTYGAAESKANCASSSQSGIHPEPCSDYPLTTSHIHFRAQSLRAKNTTVPEFTSSEYEISNRQLEALKRVGGVVGAFVTEDPLEPPRDQPPMPFSNDCAGSSKGFGYSFLYALSKMGGSRVGIATDYTFIPFVAPRFGAKACWPYQRADNPEKERKMNSTMYLPEAQQNAVRYKDSNQPPAPGVRFGNNDGLSRYTMMQHRFDYNTEGLANYGLLPDFLQDLKNIGMPKTAFEALFSSSEDYLKMWDRAWTVARINPGSMPFAPTEPPDCNLACNGLCPGPPSNGAPTRK